MLHNTTRFYFNTSRSPLPADETSSVYLKKAAGGQQGAVVGWLASRMSLSADQGQLAPRHAPSYRTWLGLARSGISVGLIQPLYVLVYNRDVPSPSLGCLDDDLDARQAYDALLSQAPPSWRPVTQEPVDCALLAAKFRVCNPKLVCSHPDPLCAQPRARRHRGGGRGGTVCGAVDHQLPVGPAVPCQVR